MSLGRLPAQGHLQLAQITGQPQHFIAVMSDGYQLSPEELW